MACSNVGLVMTSYRLNVAALVFILNAVTPLQCSAILLFVKWTTLVVLWFAGNVVRWRQRRRLRFSVWRLS
jgi:hypothetical protein